MKHATIEVKHENHVNIQRVTSNMQQLRSSKHATHTLNMKQAGKFSIFGFVLDMQQF